MPNRTMTNLVRKAVFQEIAFERWQKEPREPRVCPACGESKPMHRYQTYCSNRCRSKAFERRKRAAAV